MPIKTEVWSHALIHPGLIPQLLHKHSDLTVATSWKMLCYKQVVTHGKPRSIPARNAATRFCYFYLWLFCLWNQWNYLMPVEWYITFMQVHSFYQPLWGKCYVITGFILPIRCSGRNWQHIQLMISCTMLSSMNTGGHILIFISPAHCSANALIYLCVAAKWF